MGEELQQEFDANVELITGSGGVFEVIADGKKIFSKTTLGRFPNDGEIISLLHS